MSFRQRSHLLRAAVAPAGGLSVHGAEAAMHNAAADIARRQVAAGIARAQRVEVSRAVLAAAFDRRAVLFEFDPASPLIRPANS